MSRFYETDPTDPDAPRELPEYRGLRPGMSVRYENPAWRQPDGMFKTGGMDGPLMISEIIDFADCVTAILNDGEWEVNADNLVEAIVSQVVIRIVALADGRPHRDEGAYLKSWDVDARRGRGEICTTRDLAHAYRFADAGEAFKAWKTTSTVQPLRDDGEPNRPLTAFSVEIVTVELAEETTWRI
jgi:hypothetical protein